MIGSCLTFVAALRAYGDEESSNSFTADSASPSAGALAEELPAGHKDIEQRDNDVGPDDCEFLDPKSADFDAWTPIAEGEASAAAEEVKLRPFDWMHHWGFRHSSTDGRYVDKSIPLEHSSWLNRPFHVDWFLGPLLSDSPDEGRVEQTNEIFGGFRAGWDFDYFWGLEWRIGWADPMVFTDSSSDGISGTYMVSDVDLIYYPWGDTKVRPFFQLGLGMTEVGSIREDGADQEATLLSMPFGLGLQFTQTHWLAWRLEIIDNLAFGSEGIDTMHNVAFTAGMEWRLGARPNSYWPWRSSRTIW
jgi:hypothetical protein